MKVNYIAPNILNIIKISLINLFSIAFIYYLPALSHITQIPFYLIEPMRLMFLLAFIHTNRTNSLILALTLPIFSFIISAHPSIYKSIIISFELMLNYLILVFLIRKNINLFLAFLLSILVSKIFYYGFKYILISYNLVSGDLISTPLEIQIVTTLIISIYGYFLYKKSLDKL